MPGNDMAFFPRILIDEEDEVDAGESGTSSSVGRARDEPDLNVKLDLCPAGLAVGGGDGRGLLFIVEEGILTAPPEITLIAQARRCGARGPDCGFGTTRARLWAIKAGVNPGGPEEQVGGD